MRHSKELKRTWPLSLLSLNSSHQQSDYHTLGMVAHNCSPSAQPWRQEGHKDCCIVRGRLRYRTLSHTEEQNHGYGKCSMGEVHESMLWEADLDRKEARALHRSRKLWKWMSEPSLIWPPQPICLCTNTCLLWRKLTNCLVDDLLRYPAQRTVRQKSPTHQEVNGQTPTWPSTTDHLFCHLRWERH